MGSLSHLVEEQLHLFDLLLLQRGRLGPLLLFALLLLLAARAGHDVGVGHVEVVVGGVGAPLDHGALAEGVHQLLQLVRRRLVRLLLLRLRLGVLERHLTEN